MADAGSADPWNINYSSRFSPSSDGPGAEGSDQPHLWSSSGQDETADHLLQRLPDTLQLSGKAK